LPGSLRPEWRFQMSLEVPSDTLDILRGYDSVPAEKPSSSVELQDEPTAMTMPVIAYYGLSARFVDALHKSTEAPREFRLAAFLTAVGALIGRQAWVNYPRPTYPNLYTLLIGETASARKSTVIAFALDLMTAVIECTQAKVKPLYGLASIEGLAAAMKDGDSPDPYRVVIIEDELKSLLRKAQQKSVSNLIPRLTELYNCGPSFEVNTKTDKAIIKNPFACIVAASTPAWFAECIGESEISGGFLNRWTMFYGKTETLIPFPTKPDAVTWREIAEDLTCVVQQARGDYLFSPEAKHVFSQFYTTLRNASKGEGFPTDATARADLHAIKFALLFAVLDRKSRIEVDDVSRGIALATFTMEVTLSVVRTAGLSRIGAAEQKLMAALNNGRLSTREVMRKLHLSADELDRISRSLERVGEIEITTENSPAGRRRVFLEAV
jgi:hypothetical protein